MKQVRVVLFLLVLLFGIVLLIGQFYLNSWLGDTLNNFRQQYVILFAMLIIFALMFKDKLFLSIFGFFSVFFFLLTLKQVSPISIDKKLNAKYSLTTFNVYVNNQETTQIVNKLKNFHSDIVVLEEVTPKLYATLKKKLSNYTYFAIDKSESKDHVAILSRYPFIQLNFPEQFEKIRNSDTVNVICQLPSGVIHLIGVHLSNPLIFGDFASRAQELKSLAQFVGDDSDNLIVTGDFNTTPWSSYMVKFLKSAHLHMSIKNLFFQPTWMRKIPFITIPIDHVLFGKDFKVQDISVYPDSIGSDHHPVTVKFDFNKN